MTEEEMWNAVRNSDENYDGIFFYAVKTTGIFCRPSCRSKLPKKDNICYFASAEEARKAGFRPCKRCRSDLLEYDPIHEIALEIKQKLQEAAGADPEERLENIGLTPRRMTEIFKQEYHMTPKEYVNSLRLRTAMQMLGQTDEKVIDVACAAGFTSLSAFNRFFKKQMGQTPSEYRKNQLKPPITENQ